MPINKLVKSFDEAVAAVFDGATILCGGFGGNPSYLLRALANRPVKNLTIVGNAPVLGRASLDAIARTHTTKDGDFKIVRECSYEITARRCVSLIITDVAVIEVTEKGLLLKKVAPGFSAVEVQELSEPKLLVASDLKEMEL